MSITTDQLRSLLAHPGKVYAGTHKVGNIGQVYVDDASGQPSWVTVTTGLFGTAESFAPLDGARIDGNDIVVAVEEQAIKSAPRLDPDGSLSPAEEQELYRHYGLHGREAEGVGASHDEGRTDDGRARGELTDDAMTRSEERFRIGVREQEVGRARLRKYVVTEQVTRTVPVRHEEVSIERFPVSAEEAASFGTNLSIGEGSLEVVLHEEVPLVDKVVVAAERIRLGTQVVTEDTTVAGELRHEEIELEQSGVAERDRRPLD